VRGRPILSATWRPSQGCSLTLAACSHCCLIVGVSISGGHFPRGLFCKAGRRVGRQRSPAVESEIESTQCARMPCSANATARCRRAVVVRR
jgi:hypothetical protein